MGAIHIEESQPLEVDMTVSGAWRFSPRQLIKILRLASVQPSLPGRCSTRALFGYLIPCEAGPSSPPPDEP
jgi:hypothetical protein